MKNIDKTHQQSYKELSEESADFLESKLFKQQLSNHIYEELEAMKKQYFLQNETKRLVERQSVNTQNYLREYLDKELAQRYNSYN